MWNFKQYADNTALISDDGQSITYGRLQSEMDKLAEAAGKRCLVFSMCSNTIGSVLGYAAFLEHHIVPVLLNAHLDSELFKNLLKAYRPSFVWMPDKQAEAHNSFEKVYSAYGYSLMRNPDGRDWPLYEELTLLLTTSGSTGSQKFVRQSYKNIRVNTEQIVEYLGLDEAERPVTTLPMNYTYGCSVINTHLYVGAAILLTDKAVMTREFWSFMKEQKATSIAGVPYTYEMLEKLRFFRMDLPHLRTMTQAGGKLSPELQKEFSEYASANGKKFIVMYGACEATARMGYLPHEKAIEKYGSCGIAVPRGKFSLIDADNHVIEDAGVTGELVYEGDNVTLGYAECPEDLAKGDERHGRLETGDMAKRDEDGFYYIVGRKKRFLKVYGNRVNLDEVDRLIKAKFDYMDCASAGVDDHIYIFMTDDTKAEEVRKFISEKTSLNPSAFQVVHLESIPKNDSGKVLYTELAKYYTGTVHK
ncbi:MAG: AMP-binding protein [Clostridiales bacterium]|nr:AMP-binding protein [Clostridiales bacterium]